MKTIENLLAEYRIRFRDTEEIMAEEYPFEEKYLTPGPVAFDSDALGRTWLFNRNGKVYQRDSEGGVQWATADLKEKPDKWVVEVDNKHPKWDDFLKWAESTDRGGWMIQSFKKYCSHEGWVANQLDEDFKDHQLLTLDQWAEFFLPKYKVGEYHTREIDE